MSNNPTFQHRHYKAIAAYFAAEIDKPLYIATYLQYLVFKAADMFEADNPRFDRARFIAAANGEPINGRDKVKP